MESVLNGFRFWPVVFVLSTFCSLISEAQIFPVKENSPEGTLVLNFIEDFSLGVSEHQIPDLNFVISNPLRSHFKIINAELRCTDIPLDREELCHAPGPCRRNMRVTLVSPREFFRNFDLTIEVIDENDNEPIFSSPIFQLSVPESVPLGNLYNLPLATDRDVGSNDIETYEMEDANLPFDLLVRQTNSRIKQQVSLRVKNELDREKVSSYQFKVKAIDSGEAERKTGTLTINVKVVDVNDNGPIFEKSLYHVTVDEDFPVGGVITTLTASDADEGLNGEIKYELVPGQWEEEQMFRLDGATGELSLLRPFDHSRSSDYSIEVMATDSSPEAFSNFTRVEISVNDINNNHPQLFLNPLVDDRAEVYENAERGSFVLHILARDADSDDNGRVNCSITDSFPEENAFAMEHMTDNEFRLITAAAIDREVTQSYRLTLHCKDFGIPALNSSTDVNINVMDVDDNQPFFEKPLYVVELEENNQVGHPLLQVKADDLDSGINASMKFSLCQESIPDMSGVVTLDASTGLITALQSFDYESQSEYKFCVAVDNKCNACSHPPSSPTTARTTVLLKIIDKNDNAPEFMRKMYKFEIPENSPFSTDVGMLRATDKDSERFNNFTFQVQDNSSGKSALLPFYVDPQSGKILTSASLDRENIAFYNFSVKAVDSNDPGLSSSVAVEIRILDLNDNSPTFLSDCQDSKTDLGLVESEIIEICRFATSDPDEDKNGLVTYSIIRDVPHKIFNISSTDGTLYLNTFSLIDAPKGLFINSTAVLNVTILAKDGGSPQLSTILKTTSEIKLLPVFSIETLREKRDGYFVGRPLRMLALCGLILAILGLVAVTITVVACKNRRKQSKPVYDVQVKQGKVVPRDSSVDEVDESADEADNMKPLNGNNNKTLTVYPSNQNFHYEERGHPLKYNFSEVPNSSLKKKGKSHDSNQYFSLTKKRKGSITDKSQDKTDAIYKPSADPPKKQPVFFKPQTSSDETHAGSDWMERSHLRSPPFNLESKFKQESNSGGVGDGTPSGTNSHDSNDLHRSSTNPGTDENYPYSQVSTFFEYQNQSNKKNLPSSTDVDSRNIYY